MGCEPVMVSVIIPCYNCEKSVDETLRSMERQTCDYFEIICVDDGSTDDTLKLLTDWKDRIRIPMTVIHKENGGVGAARNTGIGAAHGKYILFCDADDAFGETMIAKLTQAAEGTKADVAYGRLSRKREDVFGQEAREGAVLRQNQEEAMHNLLFAMWAFGFYCYLYRTDTLNRFCLRFDETAKFGEDREFIWKYMCHCNTAAYVDAPLYWYRESATSVTRGKMTWRRTDSIMAVERTKKYLLGNKCAYYDTYCSYMPARVTWAVAKAFAADRQWALYQRFLREYDVRTSMKRTARDRVALVRIASWLFLIHPTIFYFLIGLYSR